MKKGCLSILAVFIIVCLLFSMCSSEESTEIDNSTPTTIQENTEESTTAPPHTHNFSDATCSVPKTCSICNATEGDLLEHTWVDATCSAPKTCSVCATTSGETLEHSWKSATCTKLQQCSLCGETTGELAPHNYSKGKCKVCGDLDPTDPRNITVWIPTHGGTKYHSHPSCSNMKNPKKTTQYKAEKAGYEPCSRC